jgi:hypothetical protein
VTRLTPFVTAARQDAVLAWMVALDDPVVAAKVPFVAGQTSCR